VAGPPIRRPLNFGYAEHNQLDMVEVGDRLVPRVIDVVFPGVGDQPRLDMRIEVIKGVPRCVSLALARTENGREVQSKDLRLVRIEDWLTYIVAACSEPYTRSGGTTVSTLYAGAPTSDSLSNVAASRKRQRPKVIDRGFLEKVAAIYREHFDDRPVKAIEKAFGVERRTAAWYVQLCRSDEYQLLPKTERGKKRS
jgi:hypothetical protein